MECVSTSTTSILVNGSPTYEFNFEHGLRQGDPLSSFLLLIAAEGLNVIMKSTTEAGLFTCYKVGRSDSVSISHLQFADDAFVR